MKRLSASPVSICSPVFVCLWLVFASGWALAQQTTNSVTGHVEDPSRASMAGAKITLRDAAGSVKARTATNSAGQFSISGVLPGEYVLEAEHKMFETSREQISISNGTPPPDLQIVMKVATRRETVDVFQQEGYAVTATSIATKTDTPILEIPLSVQVVPREVLQDQQVTRIDEAVRNVSGVYQTNAWSGEFADQFVIRGFLNYQVLYRDGFRMDTGFVGRHETANIEQIEVIKGPASILYGLSLIHI